MMKHLLIRLIFSVFLLASAVCSAADGVYGEQTVPVGAIWRLQAARITYEVDNGSIAKLIKDMGEPAVQLVKPGTVKVTAYVPGGGRCDVYTYLLHVVAGEAAERLPGMEEYARVKQRPYSGNYAQAVLRLVNAERARSGAGALRLDSDLQAGAAVRAQELTELFSHTRPNGKKCDTVLKNRRYVGENIAAGSNTPEAVVKQWMNSPGHRANILNPAYHFLGVGYVYAENSQYTHYWVQMFRG